MKFFQNNVSYTGSCLANCLRWMIGICIYIYIYIGSNGTLYNQYFAWTAVLGNETDINTSGNRGFQLFNWRIFCLHKVMKGSFLAISHHKAIQNITRHARKTLSWHVKMWSSIECRSLDIYCCIMWPIDVAHLGHTTKGTEFFQLI